MSTPDPKATELKAPDPGPAPVVETKLEEVSLEEIDRILQEDDPAFSAALNEIRTVGVEAEVEIESAVEVDDSLPEETGEEKTPGKVSPLRKLLAPISKLKTRFYTRWLRLRTQAIVLFNQLALYARTLPVEFWQYLKVTFATARALLNKVIDAFLELSLGMKLMWVGFVGLSILTVVIFYSNLRGVWLPNLYPDAIHDVTTLADKVWTEPADEPRLSLYRAFPQEEIEFLFPKVIVNLKRTNNYQNPMGFFEFYVVMDSKDSALEAQARQGELHDHLQRELEEQTYAELASPLGKRRVKDILKRELNDKLTQGWVRDVLLKSMVLKP